MEMKWNSNTSMLFLISSIILASTSAFIISSPGLRRYLPNQPCVFEWKVNRSFTSFLFLNKSGSVYTSRILTHNETSAIHLVIISSQLYDAGNYTLVVTFDGDSSPSVDSNACLYVYDNQLMVNISLTEGTYPVVEGGALTLMCSATSNSQPAQYRQNLIYHFHMNNNYLHRRADGSVVENDRYTSIDDRTLRINPVSSTDQGWVHCHVCEYSCDIFDVNGVNSNIQVTISQNGKPVVTDVIPRVKKYHASVGESVTLYVYYAAVPPNNSIVWSFSSSESGSFNPIPSIWSVSTTIYTTYATLSFPFSSPNQYGFYKCTINNAMGSVSATFQILQPAPPEPPMLVQLFTTQSSINVQWNSGLDNGLQQYFRLQLYNRKLNTTSQVDRVQTLFNYSSSYSNSFSHYTYPIYHYYYYSVNYEPPNCIYYSYANYFNYTFVVILTTGVYPDTDYEVLLWSVNELGSSSAVRLSASTPARSKIKLAVSQDSISIVGDTSVINLFIEGGTTANLSIQCYELNSMKFVESTFNLTTATHQVNMTVPVGTKYQFNFRLFNNSDVLDYQTIQIPTETTKAAASTTTTCEPSSSLTIIIILAALLGVAVLFGVAELVWICCHRHRHATNTNDSSTAELSKFPTLSESKPSSRARNNYTEESFYTSLDDQQEGPQEVYQNVQPSQNDTITPKRKAMPLPAPGRY